METNKHWKACCKFFVCVKNMFYSQIQIIFELFCGEAL